MFCFVLLKLITLISACFSLTYAALVKSVSEESTLIFLDNQLEIYLVNSKYKIVNQVSELRIMKLFSQNPSGFQFPNVSIRNMIICSCLDNLSGVQPVTPVSAIRYLGVPSTHVHTHTTHTYTYIYHVDAVYTSLVVTDKLK